MKKKKRGFPHEGLALPEDLSKRLAAYALAATAAAGMGLMGAPTLAEAGIITYTPSPPFKVVPTAPPAFDSQRFTSRGVPLLGFTDLFSPSGGASLSAEAIGGLNNPHILASAVPCGILACAAKLRPGQPIGRFATFSGIAHMAGDSDGFPASWPWLRNRIGIGYLGLEFTNDGKSYFGWAKMSVTESSKGRLDATLDEVGVDTVAGQTIKAGQTSPVPEPGTLSLLALGAAGLFALRKRKRSAVSHQQSANN